ncbi:hypothetical protein DIPPA_02747 [Diplonema papillatum]|nr:hypothetical protein DIPPA_02747 [Diplonema papillatum]
MARVDEWRACVETPPGGTQGRRGSKGVTLVVADGAGRPGSSGVRAATAAAGQKRPMTAQLLPQQQQQQQLDSEPPHDHHHHQQQQPMRSYPPITRRYVAAQPVPVEKRASPQDPLHRTFVTKLKTEILAVQQKVDRHTLGHRLKPPAVVSAEMRDLQETLFGHQYDADPSRNLRCTVVPLFELLLERVLKLTTLVGDYASTNAGRPIPPNPPRGGGEVADGVVFDHSRVAGVLRVTDLLAAYVGGDPRAGNAKGKGGKLVRGQAEDNDGGGSDNGDDDGGKGSGHQPAGLQQQQQSSFERQLRDFISQQASLHEALQAHAATLRPADADQQQQQQQTAPGTQAATDEAAQQAGVAELSGAPAGLENPDQPCTQHRQQPRPAHAQPPQQQQQQQPQQQPQQLAAPPGIEAPPPKLPPAAAVAPAIAFSGVDTEYLFAVAFANAASGGNDSDNTAATAPPPPSPLPDWSLAVSSALKLFTPSAAASAVKQINEVLLAHAAPPPPDDAGSPSARGNGQEPAKAAASDSGKKAAKAGKQQADAALSEAGLKEAAVVSQAQLYWAVHALNHALGAAVAMLKEKDAAARALALDCEREKTEVRHDTAARDERREMDVRSLRADLARVAAELDQANRDLAQAQGELRTVCRVKNTHRKAFVASAADPPDSAAHERELQKQIKAHENEMANLRTERQQFEAERERLQADFDALQRDNASIRLLFKQAQIAQQQCAADNVQLTSEIEALQQRGEALRQAATRATANKEADADKIRKLSIELSINKNTIADLRKRGAELAKDAESSEWKWQHAKKALDADRLRAVAHNVKTNHDLDRALQEAAIQRDAADVIRREAQVKDAELRRLRDTELKLESLQRDFKNYTMSRIRQGENAEEEHKRLRECLAVLSENLFKLPTGCSPADGYHPVAMPRKTP